MLKPLTTQFLQHLVSQNHWAKPMLKPFAGKILRIKVFPITADLNVLEDGNLCMAGESMPPDATMTISSTMLIRVLAKDERAHNQIQISGDSEFASILAKVLQNMAWDVEEDMSHLIGDIAAHKTTQTAQKIYQESRKQINNLSEMLVEYWQEEQPLLAKLRHVTIFNHDVDTLREDVARLEKRIKKLMG